jgi:hypothetical protein
MMMMIIIIIIVDLLTSIVPFSMGMLQAVRCSSKCLKFGTLKGPDGDLYVYPQSHPPNIQISS